MATDAERYAALRTYAVRWGFLPKELSRVVQDARATDDDFDAMADEAVEYVRKQDAADAAARGVMVDGEPLLGEVWMAFGNHEGKLIALPEYAAASARAVGDKIMEGARREGYRGSLRERLESLGWSVRRLTLAAGVRAVVAPSWGPEHPDWKATHGCTHECRQGGACRCDDEAADGVAIPAAPSREHAELMLLAAHDLESWMKSYHRDAATESTVQKLKAAALGVKGTALSRFNECGGMEEADPLERLRFFCSLAMNGQDWLDVESFFDAVRPRGVPVVEASSCRKEVALLLNKLVLMAGAQARQQPGEPPEDRITDAEIDALEAQILALACGVTAIGHQTEAPADANGAAERNDELIRLGRSVGK